MTVSELISRLKDFNPVAEIWVDRDDFPMFEEIVDVGTTFNSPMAEDYGVTIYLGEGPSL
jgi:hypothetical protein